MGYRREVIDNDGLVFVFAVARCMFSGSHAKQPPSRRHASHDFNVANLVVGMGGERGNKRVGASEWERCLYKDTNGLSKYARSVHNN